MVLTKAVARELTQKIEVFEATTKTKKSIQLALIAPLGIKRNVWSEDLVDAVVTAQDLFLPQTNR